MPLKRKLLILGASGQGKVVLDIFRLGRKFTEYAFLDDNAALSGARILSAPLVGTLETLESWKSRGFRSVFVAIGDNRIRERLHKRVRQAGFSIPVAVHPRSVMASDIVLGEGTCVMAGAVINPCSSIGEGCIINTGSSVDHDSRIDDFAQIMPGVHLAGTVHVGRRAAIGTGAVVLPNLTIADDAVIGAGAVVTKDILSTIPHVGVPARPMSQRSSHAH